MLEKLTQEQQWGLAYKCQTANSQAAERSSMIVEQNKRIEKENENLIEKKLLLEVPAVLSVEEYVIAQLAQMGDQGYAAIFEFKMNAAKEKIKSLPPEQLNALLAQFEIPDAIKS